MEKGNESKIEVNRYYKLTNKTTFSLWYDYLISEMKLFNLFDVIDKTTRITQYSEQEKEKRDI